MNKEYTETELLIVNAARKVFLNKGMDGARMQEIADEAGINKALLHYYFRNKQKLFDAVFQEALEKFFPAIVEVLINETPFIDKIDILVDMYFDRFKENPHIVSFIIHEINQNPERIENVMKESGMRLDVIKQKIQEMIEVGKISFFSFDHFMVNMLGLIIWPFAGRPLIQRMLFENDPEKFDDFLEERKTVVKRVLKKSLE